jgi:hypothetical protein
MRNREIAIITQLPMEAPRTSPANGPISQPPPVDGRVGGPYISTSFDFVRSVLDDLD